MIRKRVCALAAISSTSLQKRSTLASSSGASTSSSTQLGAREQRQALQPLARRARHHLEPGTQRILTLVEREMGPSAAEEGDEELAEMLVDLGEGGKQALAAL